MPTRPIVFVHGNGTDGSCWDPAVDHFRRRGYSTDDLWPIEFGSGTTSHPDMAAQLDDYIATIRNHTGASDVDIVAHSLGVTGARWWLHDYDGHEHTNTFVGIAGANHGLTTSTWVDWCGLSYGPWAPSGFLRADYERIDDHPLKILNEDETPGDTTYYTIRGTRDDLFALDPESPRLEGAERNVVLDEGHGSLLTSGTTLALLASWLD